MAETMMSRHAIPSSRISKPILNFFLVMRALTPKLFVFALSLSACVPTDSSLQSSSAQKITGGDPLGIVDSPKSAALRTAPRLALVIGNDEYINKNAWSTLRLAKNDATSMAQSLYKRGFILIGGSAQINVSSRKFRKLIDDTETAIRSHPGAIVIVYFAGHGFVDNGHNYLVPVDAAEQAQASSASINVIDVAHRLKAAGDGLTVMFLDACRDYAVGHSGGLTSEIVPDNVFIGFAAQFGSSSHEPPDSQHGYYTDALIRTLDSRFSRFDDMHYTVSTKVIAATTGQQVPVFRQGRNMPAIPVDLSFTNVQTGYALARRNSTRTDIYGSQCAALTDFKFAVDAFGAVSSNHGSTVFTNSVNNADRTAIENSCTKAFDNGNRNPAILRGLALTKLASASQQDVLSGIALLTQAAETGDGLSNYMMAIYASSYKYGLNYNHAMDRLIAAADRGDPAVTGLVALTLLDPRDDVIRLNAMLHQNKDIGRKLFRNALSAGDAASLLVALVLKRVHPELVSGIRPYDFIKNGLTGSSNIELAVRGINGLQTMYYFAAISAAADKEWSEFVRLMLLTEPFFDDVERSIALKSGIESRPGVYSFLAGCMVAFGTDIYTGRKLEGITANMPMAINFIKHSGDLGVPVAGAALRLLKRGLPCK